MEITVISAEGLKSTSSLPFCRHSLRSFVTLTAYPPPSSFKGGDCEKYSCHDHVFSTRVDDEGGVNPTWGDKFHVPVDLPAFFANRYSCIYLQIFTKRPMLGTVQLGWCQVPVADIGYLPEGSVRHLSYRVRTRDGRRGHGIINIAIRLTGFPPVVSHKPLDSNQRAKETCETVIGIPVAMFPHMNVCQLLP